LYCIVLYCTPYRVIIRRTVCLCSMLRSMPQIHGHGSSVQRRYYRIRPSHSQVPAAGMRHANMTFTVRNSSQSGGRGLSGRRRESESSSALSDGGALSLCLSSVSLPSPHALSLPIPVHSTPAVLSPGLLPAQPFLFLAHNLRDDRANHPPPDPAAVARWFPQCLKPEA
jgi:hypothetical protein